MVDLYAKQTELFYGKNLPFNLVNRPLFIEFARALRKSKFQDFKLQAAGANPSKKEKRLAAGALTIQFNDCAQYASPRDKEQGTFLYPGDMKFWRQEADKIDRPRRDKESEMAKKLAKAREDFAV